MNATCPICRCSQSEPVLEASRQPLLLNHLCATREEALAARRGDFSFRGCNDCGFAWNAVFDAGSVVYGPGYVNDQSQSAVFRTHLDQITHRLIGLVEGVPGTIIEVGCGQGGFLKSLCDLTGRTGTGFDPALTRSGHLSALSRVCASRFDDDALDELTGPVALIYCRHVLEHLADPASMVRTMVKSLAGGGRGAMYLEVPAFEWIARHSAFFDLFNEHCSLFTVRSMAHMLRTEGLANIAIDEVFGGQYLAASGRAATSTEPMHTRIDGHRFADRFIDMTAAARRLAQARARCGQRLDQLLSTRPVHLWGGGAKGVSLVNHLGLSHDRIAHLIDINPEKQGRFVPVTGQQVIAPSKLRAAIEPGSHPTILIMNPNYEDEIAQQFAKLGIAADIEVLGGGAALEPLCEHRHLDHHLPGRPDTLVV